MSLSENRFPLFRDMRAFTPVVAGYALTRRLEALGLDHAHRVRRSEEFQERRRAGGLLGVGHDRSREDRVGLDLRWQRPRELDTRNRDHLARLGEAELGLALADELRTRAVLVLRLHLL